MRYDKRAVLHLSNTRKITVYMTDARSQMACAHTNQVSAGVRKGLWTQYHRAYLMMHFMCDWPANDSIRDDIVQHVG